MAHPAGRQAPGRNHPDRMTAAHLAGRQARKQPEVSHEPLSNGGSTCVSTSRGVRNRRHPITWPPGLSPVAGVHSSAVALTNGFDLAFLVGAGFAVAGAILAAVLISSRDSHEHSKAARSGEAAGIDAAAVPVAAG